MTLDEALIRLATARVELTLLVSWLNVTDRPRAGDAVQRSLLDLIDAINVVLQEGKP